MDRNAASKLKTQKGTDRKRRRLKAEIDAFIQKLRRCWPTTSPDWSAMS